MNDTISNFFGKNVAFDEETEAIVKAVVQERHFPETQGFSLAVRTIIREWYAMKQAAPRPGGERHVPDMSVVGV